jgi:nucleoside-diphosphate-sugar epimerase
MGLLHKNGLMSLSKVVNDISDRGAGYIGSHICAALAEACHDFLMLNKPDNDHGAACARLEQIHGIRIGFIEANIRDGAFSESICKPYLVIAIARFESRDGKYPNPDETAVRDDLGAIVLAEDRVASFHYRRRRQQQNPTSYQ